MDTLGRLARQLLGDRPVTLSKIRIQCRDADRASLHIKSTLDNTYKLDFHTDEDVSFTDDDLIAIKNCKADPCTLTVKAIRLPEGRRAIFSPSRQSSKVLLDPEVSTIRAECTLVLGAGETCMLRTSAWKEDTGRGSMLPV